MVPLRQQEEVNALHQKTHGGIGVLDEQIEPL